MKKLISILIVCMILVPVSLAESTHTDDFLSGLSQAWGGLLGMAEDAGKSISSWADESGVTGALEDAGKSINAWADESGVTAWANTALSDLQTWANDSGFNEWAENVSTETQKLIDENRPAVEAWLEQTGQEARNAWDTLLNAEDHTQEEVSSAMETLTEALNPSEDFYISPITDEIFERIDGKSFKPDCTLPRDDLRYLHVLHVDLDGVIHEGEMIVNAHIAQDVLDILHQLYDAGYPIEKIRLVDEYDADDELSMEDNNSSSFNFRFISHTTKVSKHGLGLAVDINTLYNPYTKIVDGERIVEPITAEAYLDRDADFPYKIEKGDLCYRLFIEHGFEWGGEWEDRKDYQHFEIPTNQIEEWYPANS